MSTTSSSSTTKSSPTISTTTNTPTSLPHIQHLITIKLTRDNYLLWKAQIVPYLRGQHLYGFIDGTKPAPVSSLTVPDSGTIAALPNPEFYIWHTQDQMILSALISSISETMLAHVVKCSTSRDSLPFNNTVEKSHSMSSMVTFSLTSYAWPNINPPLISLASANFANRSSSIRGGRGVRLSTPSASSNSGRSFPSNQHCQYRGCGRGRGNYNNSPRPVCQVCTKPNHSALTCYHRFDNSYTVDSTSNMQALLATLTHAPDPNWYSDSGATHHLTSDLANLNVCADEYHGPNQIRVGSGFGENTTMRAE
uniref:Retrotransposon Copia-like N-terminal domain-containing protein n=1 Tax=Fagus sylvatica TaxID=28930 RepID=A0A2N9IZQ3_FAGSY